MRLIDADKLLELLRIAKNGSIGGAHRVKRIIRKVNVDDAISAAYAVMEHIIEMQAATAKKKRSPDLLLSQRQAVVDRFAEWAGERLAEVTPLNLMTFLVSEELLNTDKVVERIAGWKEAAK